MIGQISDTKTFFFKKLVKIKDSSDTAIFKKYISSPLGVPQHIYIMNAYVFHAYCLKRHILIVAHDCASISVKFCTKYLNFSNIQSSHIKEASQVRIRRPSKDVTHFISHCKTVSVLEITSGHT